jgi:hypothetical protein
LLYDVSYIKSNIKELEMISKIVIYMKWGKKKKVEKSWSNFHEIETRVIWTQEQDFFDLERLIQENFRKNYLFFELFYFFLFSLGN